MDINHLFESNSEQGITPWPTITFGTLRLWDTYTMWGDFSKSRGVYDFSTLDEFISLAKSKNVDLSLTFGGVPKWAIPTNIAISNLSRTSNVVTVTTKTPHGMFYLIYAGATNQSQITIAGALDSSFNGTYYLTGTPTSTTLTFAQTAADATSSSGTMSAVCSGNYIPHGACAEAPINIQDWNDFVTALMNHVGPGVIKSFEMWNEFNELPTWKSDLQTLVNMTASASKIIKTTDPNAIILSPSTTKGYGTTALCAADYYCGTTMMSRWYALGGNKYIDAVSFHGYPHGTEDPEQIVGQISLHRAAMSAVGIGNYDIWDTEASWGKTSQLPDETDQASWLARHFLLEQSQGLPRSFWYSYDAFGDTWGTLWDVATGLIPDGNAYTTLTHWLIGSSLTSPCANVSGNIWSCSYTKAGVAEKIIWSTSGTVSYTVGTSFKSQFDILTNTSTPVVSGVISVSELPILVKSTP